MRIFFIETIQCLDKNTKYHLCMEDFASESDIYRFVLKVICLVLRNKVVTTFYFVGENTPTHTHAQSSKSFKCYPEAPETMQHLSDRRGKISPAWNGSLIRSHVLHVADQNYSRAASFYNQGVTGGITQSWQLSSFSCIRKMPPHSLCLSRVAFEKW